jgi:phosphatidylglycerol:prolipoprotein diacylglycerol transferase
VVEVTMQGISIGPFDIRFYSLAIILGITAGVLIGRAEAKRRGLDTEIIYGAIIWGVPAGIIGGRLYHVLDPRNIDRYLDDPLSILAVWEGGLGIYGTMAAAVVTVLIYMRVKGQSTPMWLDIGAPAFLAGQAIGRWGNYFNQELFGRPTDLPWGIHIPEHRVAAEAPHYLGETHFHPLFFYESSINALGVVVLLLVARRLSHRIIPGDIFLLYLMWYPATRFTLEFLRASTWTVGPLSGAQWVSLALIAVAGSLLVWRHRRGRPVAADGEPRSGEPRAARRRRASK